MEISNLSKLPTYNLQGKPIVQVVAALIQKDDFVLITQRKKGKSYEKHWEFPGGKVEKSEDHDHALRREIREELAVDVELGSLVYSTKQHTPLKEIQLYIYRAIIINGTLTPLEVESFQWVLYQDIIQYQFIPADGPLVYALSLGIVDKDSRDISQPLAVPAKPTLSDLIPMKAATHEPT